MKISQKIIFGLLMSGCILSQNAAQAAFPINAYVGASMGFQSGMGSLKGNTFVNTHPNIAVNSYPGRISTKDPAGNLFIEVDTKVINCFSLGLRPYYHFDSFEFTFSKNGDLAPAFGAPVDESADFSLRRRHAYGALLIPKFSLEKISLYGLLGIEFSRFKGRIITGTLEAGQPTLFNNFSKNASSQAVVIGVGVTRELGNWSLFVEGQYKHYKRIVIQQSFLDLNLPGVDRTQSLKFSPKFASVMFGVKYKIC